MEQETEVRWSVSQDCVVVEMVVWCFYSEEAVKFVLFIIIDVRWVYQNYILDVKEGEECTLVKILHNLCGVIRPLSSCQ